MKLQYEATKALFRVIGKDINTPANLERVILEPLYLQTLAYSKNYLEWISLDILLTSSSLYPRRLS